MSSFQNRTALITGAASGIGLAVAQHLAANGAAKLILVDRDPLPKFSCETVAAQGDIRDEAFWDSLDLAGLDHAVVNAGDDRRARP